MQTIEVRKKADKLEEAIKKIVLKFTEETGMLIRDGTFSSDWDYIDEKNNYVYKAFVTLKVQLG